MEDLKITITNVNVNITKLIQDSSTVELIICGYNVDFIVNMEINSHITITTDKEMDMKEIKEYIKEKVWR